MRNKREDISDFLKDEYFIYWVTRSDPKAETYWENWIKQHPEKLKLVKVAREMISSFQYQHNYQLPPEKYEDILQSLKVKQAGTHYLNKDRDKSTWYLKIAASLLILIGVGLRVWLFYKVEETTTADSVELVVKRAQKGEKLSIKLPDGSRVKLNSNSTLVAPTRFEEDVRKVELSGEALFEVAENHNKPFIISSGEVRTRVLGTSFNVRAYQEEQTVEVAVVSGKVSVEGNGAEKVILLPDIVSLYNTNNQSLTTRQQDVSDIIAWSKNILIFDRDTETKVWNKLENWFGVDIITPYQAVIQGRYSGRFFNESLERVLDGISYASGFSYEIQTDQTVIINVIPNQRREADSSGYFP